MEVIYDGSGSLANIEDMLKGFLRDPRHKNVLLAPKDTGDTSFGDRVQRSDRSGPQ